MTDSVIAFFENERASSLCIRSNHQVLHSRTRGHGAMGSNRRVLPRNDARVAQVLGISSNENGDSKPKVQYRGLEKLPQGKPSTLATQGQQYEGPFFRLWKSLLSACTSDSEMHALQYLKDHMRGTSYERPWQGAELHIEDDPKPIRPMLAWLKQRFYSSMPPMLRTSNAQRRRIGSAINWGKRDTSS